MGLFAITASHSLLLSGATPIVAQLAPFGLPTWAYWALGIVCSLSVTTIAYLVYRFYQRRRAEQSSRPSESKDAVPQTALRDIWTRFLSELPRSARAAVPNYPTFLLLGPASAGKSHVVRSRIDWQEQTGQLIPSYTADPMLQIYIGSRALAMELSAPLLLSNQDATREAVSKLFSTAFKHRNPTVLVVVDMATVIRTDPDTLAHQGQSIRAKLNLLAKALRSPIETRLVLTHMEQTEGYSAFAKYLNHERIPLELPLHLLTNREGGLGELLSSYEQYLPHALINVNADQFRGMIKFLNGAPRHLRLLEPLLQPLLQANAAYPTPHLEKIYLHAAGKDEQLGNPFHLTRRSEAGRGPRPIISLAWWRGRTHLAVCAGVAAALFLVLLTLVIRHGRKVHRSEDAADGFEQAVGRAQHSLNPSTESAAVRAAEQNSSQLIGTLLAADEKWTLYRILYQDNKEETRIKHVETIRKGYLVPSLEKAAQLHQRDRLIYTLAVLYANKNNSLGGLVLAQPGEFATTIGVSESVIRDYLAYGEDPWQGSPTLLATVRKGIHRERSDVVMEVGMWSRFFDVLERAVQQQKISDDDLKLLRQGSEPLLTTLDAVVAGQTLARVFRMLTEEAPLGDLVQQLVAEDPTLAPPPWMRDQVTPMRGVLKLVHDTTAEQVKSGKLNLYQVLQVLTDTRSRREGNYDKYVFELQGHTYLFNAREFLNLLMRSRSQQAVSTLFVRKTAKSKQQSELERLARRLVKKCLAKCDRMCDAQCTIPDMKRYSDLLKQIHDEDRKAEKGVGDSPSGTKRDGKPQPGKALPRDSEDAENGLVSQRHGRRGNSRERVVLSPKLAQLVGETGSLADAFAGAYNKASFERDIRPVLTKFDKAIEETPELIPAERELLQRYVAGEARHYARRYCDALLAQHKSYIFAGGGVSSTHAELVSSVLPGGALTNHLKMVADNAQLGDLSAPYLRPLGECIALFQPLIRVMTPSKEGGYPGLKPYAEILSGIVKELDTGKPAATPEDGKTLALSDMLSPLGRMALSSLQELATAPDKQVQQYLDGVGLAGPLSGPFVAPVHRVVRLGQNEIEHTLAEYWQSGLRPQVEPILDKFPFNRSAEGTVEPRDLDQLKPSDGLFWQSFRSKYGPVCLERSGDFVPKRFPKGNIALPDGMLPLVNQLAKVSRNLFGKDGSRMPLDLRVRALPLAATDGEVPGTLSFLAAGKSVVYGINSAPTPRPLQVSWWQPDPASVGLEYSTAEAGRKQTQSLDVGEVSWGFFRLLNRGQTSEPRLVTWTLPGDGGRSNRAVKFEFVEDPWALLKVRR